MATVKDIAADKFIAALALHLENSNKFPAPKNVDIIKTASINELAPLNEKWYYIRLASVFRGLYINNGRGVGAIARTYGGNGTTKIAHKKEHSYSGSRGNVRYALKQLDAAKFTSKKAGKNGRFLTDAGRRELDNIAKTLKA
jgi:small subunit ribosomal protein S19e